MTGNYNKSLQLLSNLNEFDYTGASDTFIDQGSSAVMYYSALMDAYRGLEQRIHPGRARREVSQQKLQERDPQHGR